jgi:8-oxo-dGTP pyrophosphatase MutT (NUDIX family)
MPTTHLLARAVIRKKRRLLVVQAEGQSHTFLPGGHVEDGEGMEACLRRELWEELGVEAQVGAYRGAVEHRWGRDGEPQYELNHCFAVEVPSLSPKEAPPAQEEYLTFRWVPVGALDEADLQPAPLRRFLSGSIQEREPWWASTLPASAAPEGADASSQ